MTINRRQMICSAAVVYLSLSICASQLLDEEAESNLNATSTSLEKNDEPKSLDTLYEEMSSLQFIDIPLNSSACSAFKNVEFINTTDGTIQTPFIELQRQIYGDLVPIRWEETFAFAYLLLNCLKAFIKDKYLNILEEVHPYLSSVKELKHQDPCWSILQNKDLIMLNVNYHEDLIWIPHFNTCIDEDCFDFGSTMDLIFHCRIALKDFQDDRKNYSNVLDGDPGEDLRFSIIPSFPWSCPELAWSGDSPAYYDSVSSILENLSIRSRLIAQYCEPLLCTSKIYGFSDMHVHAVVINSLDEGKNCIGYSTRNSSFSNRIKIFSIDVTEIQRTVFIVGNVNDLDENEAKLLTLFHYADDSEIKRCCNEMPKDHYFLYSRSNSLVCYASNETCLSMNKPWHNSEILLFPDHFLLVLNRTVATSRLFQSLATLNLDISSNTYQYLLTMDYNYTTYKKMNVISTEVNPSDKINVDELIGELRENGLHCTNKDYFEICHKYSVILVFLYNCSSVFPGNGKLFLLINSVFLSSSLDNEYLCQNNTAIVLTEFSLPPTGVRHDTLQYDPYSKRLLEAIYRYCRNPGIRNVKDNKDRVCQFLVVGEDLFPKSSNFFVFSFITEDTEDAPFTLDENLLSNATGIFEMINHGPLENNILAIRVSQRNDSTSVFIKQNHKHKASILKAIHYTIELLTLSGFSKNRKCYEDIYSRKFSIQVDVTDAIKLLIGPITSDFQASPCLSILPGGLYDEMEKHFSRNKTSINKLWPTCLNNMFVGLYDNGGEVPDWNYLPIKCKSQEFALLACSVALTLITVVGNTYVLVILVVSGLVKKNPFMIRFSLSFADLLMGIIPSAFAVYNHISLMTGSLRLTDLDPEGTYTSFTRLQSQQTEGFQQLRFERHDIYSKISSIVMTISICVSTFSMCLISIDNLSVLRGRPLKRRYIKLLIGISWLWGIIISLLVSWHESGWSAIGYFDPITKITMIIGSGNASVSSASFYTLVAFAGVTSSAIIILTIISLATFRLKEMKTQREMELNQRARQENVRQTTVIFLYMVTLFIVSSLPPFLDLLLNFSENYPILHFFSWWFFMAGASWNWIIYSLKGKTFKKESSRLHEKLVRKAKSFWQERL